MLIGGPFPGRFRPRNLTNFPKFTTMHAEVSSSNPVVRALIEGTAPRPACLAAARGMLPLPHHDLLEVLVAFSGSPDAEIADHARQALATQDDALLAGTLRTDQVATHVLEHFVSRDGLSNDAVEAVVTNKLTPVTALTQAAFSTKNAYLLDLLAMNQQLLIQTPTLIEAILSNPNRSSDADRRASETKREFFEKERGQQQIASELRAQGKDAAAEFIEQATFESDEDALLIASMIEVPDSETDDSWLGLEYIEELYEESPEERQALIEKVIGEFSFEESDIGAERISVINRIMKMGMKDRVKLAMKGDREARNILIRDPNRIVATAVVNNPRITEQEVEKIASMRSLPDDVLRGIAVNRQFSKNYVIAHNLAKNPRTPIANVLNILPRLQLRDLAAMAKNKGVSDAVRRQALRLAQSRTGR
jgi:hypothetical protein